MFVSLYVQPVASTCACDVDPEADTVTGKRPFATIAEPGVPDGAVVDEEGFLWCALYGGGELARFAPDGRRERTIPLRSRSRRAAPSAALTSPRFT